MRGTILTICYASLVAAQMQTAATVTNGSESSCDQLPFDYTPYAYSWYDTNPDYTGSTLLGNITNMVVSLVENNTFADHPDTYPYPPGVVVTIQTPDGVFEQGYGYSDAGLQLEMEANSRVEIGSNTKIFTGTLLMQAHEQGLLDVNDLMGKYIPDITAQVANGDQITIRQLMTHNTGLYDYGDDIIFNSLGSRKNLSSSYTPEELVESVQGRPVGFTPGACDEFAYSNTGYVLVGLILESVHNKTLAELMSENIFQPLNLTDTTFAEGSPNSTILDSHGYSWNSDTSTAEDAILLDTTRWNLDQGWSAGGIISTGRDMVTFARALGRGELFEQGTETFTLMTDFYRATMMASVGFSGYGYGLGESFSPDLYSHGGQTLGFLSTFVFSVDQDFQVFIAQNEAAEGIAHVLASEFLTFMPSPEND